MRDRAVGAAVLTGAFLLLWLSGAGSVQAAPKSSLLGTTTDPVGTVLEGVEIFVLGGRTGSPPVAVVRSGPDGRFFVADLMPGVYRIAGVKDGYLTYLGRFSTALRTTVDIVLQPVGTEEPADMSWVLRIPARSLFRETEAGVATSREDGRGGPTVLASDAAAPVQGQVDHLVALQAGVPVGGSDLTRVQGGETRMRLAGQIGERTSIRLQGRRESMDGLVRSESLEDRPVGREAAGLLLDLSYDTSLDGQLAVKAFYATQDGDTAPGTTVPLADRPQAQRSWGYDATWSRQIDPASRLAVQLAYLDTSLGREPGGVEPAAQVLDLSPEGTFMTGRALGARGSYESLLHDGHQLRVGVRARSRDLVPQAWNGDEQVLTEFLGREDARWGVRLDAEDEWSVTGPLTLVYGVAYEQDVQGRAPSVFVNRTGASWSGGDFHLTMLMTHHSSISGGLGDDRDVHLSDSLGYEGSLEVPLSYGLRVTGEVVSSPLHDDQAFGIALAHRPIYLTDGRASVRQTRVTVERQSTTGSAWLQLSQGSAEGTLSPVVPFDIALGLLQDRRLDYLTGRLGFRIAPSGTDLVAEYRRVEDAMAAHPAPPSLLEYLELKVAQDLLRLAGRGGQWRLLLAARTTREDAGPEPFEAEAGLASLNHWIGAGVSVAF